MGDLIYIGKEVREKVLIDHHARASLMNGIIDYIHPNLYFYRVKFNLKGATIHQCFQYPRKTVYERLSYESNC